MEYILVKVGGGGFSDMGMELSHILKQYGSTLAWVACGVFLVAFFLFRKKGR